jgi:biotin--protein ligase
MVKIAVYRDEGASALSLVQLVKALRRLFAKAEVIRIDRHDIMKTDWKAADLLIFPGGRDLFYHQTLSGEPVEEIRRWVLNGGRYWGICAGGYFGTSWVDLGIGGGNRVESPRQMQLFPGKAIGPSLGNVPYDYLSQKDCGLTPIKVSPLLCEGDKSDLLWAYYNTGCSFKEEASVSISTQIPIQELGWYTDPRASGHPCAIVESFPGKGYALLCGIHPEFHADYMPQSDDLETERVIQELKAKQKQIDDLFLRLLLRALHATKERCPV